MVFLLNICTTYTYRMHTDEHTDENEKFSIQTNCLIGGGVVESSSLLTTFSPFHLVST